MNPSGINIKASHKGRFTAWATAHGFSSVAAAANAVMANPSKYDPAVVKMANFAKNARGFSHAAPTASKLAGS
jgi:hypothetical protein